MESTLIKNIKTIAGIRHEDAPLRGAELGVLPAIDDAWLRIEDDQIHSFGAMSEPPAGKVDEKNNIDAKGGFVLPGWCDSHTHLVFPASRENEFIDKLKGLSYADIAAKGGGILNSAQRLADTSEDQLFQQTWQRLQEVARLGTGAIEIKSGYGLNVEGELKMLRVIKKIKEKSNLLIKASFLGAHTFPLAFRDDHQGYIDLIIHEMLPVIAKEKLADYIDVFCEKGFFSAVEMEQICNAGMQYGLRPKLHVNQLNSIGGIEVAVNKKAVSVDHLETMTETEIDLLAASDTIATLLPTAAFFLRMGYQPARELINKGAAIALASDYNPGSSPSGNMNFVVALACIQMKLLPEEAINAATLNGAHAMELAGSTGSISTGKKANIILTKPIPSLAYLPYSFGSNLIRRVMINGDWVE